MSEIRDNLTDEQIKNLRYDGFFDDIESEKDELFWETYYEDQCMIILLMISTSINLLLLILLVLILDKYKP